MRTHRCEKSLKAKVSIRYEYKYANMSVDDDYLAWRLFELFVKSNLTVYSVSANLRDFKKLEKTSICTIFKDTTEQENNLFWFFIKILI